VLLDLLLLLKMEEVGSSETFRTRVVFVPEMSWQKKAANLLWRSPASFSIARLCVVNHPHKFTGFLPRREYLGPPAFLPAVLCGWRSTE
jgi:hypothetical protein